MSPKVGQLSALPVVNSMDGGLSVAGEFKEALPMTPERKKFRYVRDSLNGSSANAGNHWVEIQVFSKGKNISAGKTATASEGSVTGSLSLITDGSVVSTPYLTTSGWIQVDLGASYEIDEVIVWHFYNDGRTYYHNKLQVSDDLENWYTVFDSETEGRYAETASGKRHILPKFGLHSYVDLKHQSTTGFQRKNMIDFSETTRHTTGTITELSNFGANSSFTTVASPFFADDSGVREPVHYTYVNVNNASANYNGGFHTRNYDVDKNSTYRVSCLLKRDSTVGTTYIGMTTNSNVTTLNSTAIDANPYFHYFSAHPEIPNGEWFFFVYHVHPVGYTGGTHADSGIYLLDGTKLVGGKDYKWSSTTTTAGIRAYLYYSTTVGNRQWLARPTFEKVDKCTAPVDYIISGGDINLLPTTGINRSTDEGAYFTRTATNLSNGLVNIYNNYSIPYTLETVPDETYNGFPITRVTFIPSTQAHLTGLANGLTGTGVLTQTYNTYKASTKYCASLYMRRVSHHKMDMGGTASNMMGWTAGKIDCTDGWERHYQTRNGTVVESKTDGVFFSIKTTVGDVNLGDKVVFEVCGVMIEEGFMYPSTPTEGNVANVKNTLDLPGIKAPFTINVKSKILRPSADYGGVQSGYPMVVQLGGYYANNSITLWKYGANLAINVKGNTSSGWTFTATKALADSQFLLKSINYTLVAKNSRDLEVYMDGVLQFQGRSSESLGEISDISFNRYNLFASIIEEVTALDYALTPEEIKNTFGGKFSIDPVGDVYGNRLVEGRNEPLPHYNFPLGRDYYDITGSKQLTTNTPRTEFVRGRLQINPDYPGNLISQQLPMYGMISRVYKITGYIDGSGYPVSYVETTTNSQGNSALQVLDSYNSYDDGNNKVVSVNGNGQPTTAQINAYQLSTYDAVYLVVRVRKTNRGVVTANDIKPYFDPNFVGDKTSWASIVHEGDGWYTLASKLQTFQPTASTESLPYSQNNWNKTYISEVYYGVQVTSGLSLHVGTSAFYTGASSVSNKAIHTGALRHSLSINMLSTFNMGLSSDFTVTYETSIHPGGETGTYYTYCDLGTESSRLNTGAVTSSENNGNFLICITYTGSTKTYSYQVYKLSNLALITTKSTPVLSTNTGVAPMLNLNSRGNSAISNLKVYPNKVLSYSELIETVKCPMRLSKDYLTVHGNLKEGGLYVG